MWRAWVNKDGTIARIFIDGEPTPEYSEKTHTLIPLDDAQLAEAKAGKNWDARTRQLVDPPPEPAKSPQEAAAEVVQIKRNVAEAWLAKVPEAVIDLLADRVAAKLAERTKP